MQPAGPVDSRRTESRTRVRWAWTPLALILVTACAPELSPERVLVVTRVDVRGPGRQQLAIEAPTQLPVLVTIRGQSVDVRASVATTIGDVKAFADAPNRRMGVETLLIEAPHDPIVRVIIERNDHSKSAGYADVTAVALPAVTDADGKRVAAARFDARGSLAYPEFDSGQNSVDAFEEAARLYDEIGDRRHAGLSRLNAAGARYARLDDWSRASELAALAARDLDREDDPQYAAMALRVEGAALDQLANSSLVDSTMRNRHLQNARESLSDAFEHFVELGNDYEAGYALNYRGVSYDVAGERERARTDFLSALEHFTRAKDEPAQALSLQSLALQSHEDGRVNDAIREFEQALALIPREEDPENYAHTLHNSALPLRVVGRFTEAIARFHEAANILRERGDLDGEARALHGIGTTLMFAGEPERASELLQSAIRLRSASGSKREQAVSLFVLGQIERDEGDLEQAISHHEQALSLVTAPHDLAQARLSLARTYNAAGRPGDAARELKALLRLTLPATHRYRGLALTELGELESLAGHDERSSQLFAESIEILKSNGSDLDSARTLVRRAESQLRFARPNDAVRDTIVALRQLEVIGLQSLQAESRAAFRASYRDAIEIQIAAHLANAEALRNRGKDLLARHATTSALLSSDRARAGLIAEPSLERQAPVSVEAQHRRNEIYVRIAGKRFQRDRLQNAASPDLDAINDLTRDIALLRTEARLLEDEVAGTPPVPGSGEARELDERLADRLPKGHVVAEYFVGRTHIWLFEVRNGKLRVHTIPAPDKVVHLARELHLAWRKPSASRRTPEAASVALMDSLFKPLDELAAGETLHLVPDGPLHLIPMTVLAEQALPHVSPGSVQIATNLAALVDPIAPKRARARSLLAVVADPIYSPDDSRLGGKLPAAPARNEFLTRSASGLERMTRLPSAAAEAASIVSLADDVATLRLEGADASRQQVEAAALEQYRIVHFATHAIADSQDPALALLALSRFDARGKSIDGELRAIDIAQLRLSADLVVLSACDTAVGREIAGEAPLGLSQAFLRSGAKAVLATLWQVPDTSTALLMQEFYRELLVNERTPATALALAQDRIRSRPRWSDPFYWAGFQLTSNSPIAFNNPT
jgi:CHAT domain-containing protein/tetratricopeptide (TPR) repeat protein